MPTKLPLICADQNREAEQTLAMSNGGALIFAFRNSLLYLFFCEQLFLKPLDGHGTVVI
jgi:hypothetical protein